MLSWAGGGQRPAGREQPRSQQCSVPARPPRAPSHLSRHSAAHRSHQRALGPSRGRIATAEPSSYFCFSPRVGRESMEHNWENAEFCPLLAVCSPCWPDGTRPPVCLVMRGRQCQRENNGAACRHYRTAATEFIALSKVLTGCKE